MLQVQWAERVGSVMGGAGWKYRETGECGVEGDALRRWASEARQPAPHPCQRAKRARDSAL